MPSKLTSSILQIQLHYESQEFPEMLVQRLQMVATAEVSPDVKVGQLKQWNKSEFEKKLLKFPTKPSNPLMFVWLQKTTFYHEVCKIFFVTFILIDVCLFKIVVLNYFVYDMLLTIKHCYRGTIQRRNDFDEVRETGPSSLNPSAVYGVLQAQVWDHAFTKEFTGKGIAKFHIFEQQGGDLVAQRLV